MEQSRRHMYIDLSHSITDGMPAYPGDESPRLEKNHRFEQDGYTDYRFTGGTHTGTHIDGPMHATSSGVFLDELPMAQFTGTGILVRAEGVKTIFPPPEFIRSLEPEQIVVVHTGFDAFFGSDKYFHEHPVLSMEFARLLVERKTRMVCLDTPSPDYAPYDIHSVLLKNSVLVAENCTCLEKLSGIKKFEIIALPLRLHADSSPARIIARYEL